MIKLEFISDEFFSFINNKSREVSEGETLIIDRDTLMHMFTLNTYELYAFLQYMYGRMKYVEVSYESTVYIEKQDGDIFTGIYDNGKKNKLFVNCQKN